MRLTKVDLTKLVAVSHNDEHLGLLIDRGNSLEYIEIPAPLAAYEGIQELDFLVALESPELNAATDDDYLLEAEKDIPMLPVESSMAQSLGYDAERQLLQVEFRSGSVYQYEDIDEETWDALQAAESTGQFYNEEIKGSYKSRRVD